MVAQAGKQDPKDPYDARNPGVKPYKGITDTEVEREEADRRAVDKRKARRTLTGIRTSVRSGARGRRG